MEERPAYVYEKETMSDSLTFDSRFLYNTSESDQNFLIKLSTVQNTQAHIEQGKEKVSQQITHKSYGFMNVLEETSYLEEVQQVFTKIQWAKNFVVVGIGGSDLGARAVQQALESDHPPMKVIFHGDSTDPVQISRLLKHIQLEETVFNIVSKSGQTVETTAQYLFFKDLYKKHVGEAWAKHFVFTTDPKEGILRPEADKYNILTVSIPPAVGGRFSVLTPVGLLPALAMGVNIEQLINGAKEFFENTSLQKMAQSFAASQYQLYQQGIKITVMMPYSVQLEEFARWFRQLWAESLGKDGKGILPIQARGPADQHSQGQFYNEGTPMQSLLFLRINARQENYVLESIDLEEMKYLQGSNFQQLINVEQEAAALAVKKQGRPSATLAIPELNEFFLGQLFAFFELAVVYLAEMLEVNAFDQPGVEEGKQMMYALLGRQGFEAKKKEIEALQK